MKPVLAFLILFFLVAPVQAQEIVSEPICFGVRNEAPYKIYGNFGTDYYVAENGTKARHRSNFRLDEPGSVDEEGYPSDRAEFCSYGPFYPDRKLEIVLRTLVPIFSCMTRIDQGEIVIKGHRKPEGGTDTWAECFE
ncbi:MAG: hypothetical protein WBK55_10500 [Alphaproteobacteria bacterium]